VERVPGSRVTVVTEALFHAISTVDSATGVIAAAPTPAGHAVPPDADLVLVLEGIQDPGNVGTLLRSAAAAGGPRRALEGLRLRLVAEDDSRRDGRALRAEHRRGRGSRRVPGCVPRHHVAL
jgi:hypothetical protein